VAVVAAPAKEGQQQRDVNVYVCDGDGINEWLPGSVTGENFKLVSDDGDAEVTGKLTRSGVTGTVELPNGKSLDFQAKPATGPGGLYAITVRPDGRMTGTSSTGGELQGRVAKAPSGGGYRFTGVLRNAQRQRFTLDFKGVRQQPTGDFRWIVASDGEVLGDRKGKRTEGSGGAFVNDLFG
jgi:hypothetical protein